MSDLRFAWRRDKYERVRREHGVRFGEAVDVRLDEQGLDIPDTVHWERSLFVGATASGRVLVVVYALEFREDAKTIYRIITAYDAPEERKHDYQRR